MIIFGLGIAFTGIILVGVPILSMFLAVETKYRVIENRTREGIGIARLASRGAALLGIGLFIAFLARGLGFWFSVPVLLLGIGASIAYRIMRRRMLEKLASEKLQP